MSFAALATSIIALAIALITWVAYLARIQKGTVERRPVNSVIALCLSLAAALAAIAWFPHAAVTATSSLTILLAAVFLGLLAVRKTPIGNLKVKVGDALLPFSAVTSDGTPFDSDSLANQRTLLKFFRGSW